jgi:putative glycerol-1-phosphate prenyltransferase/phosphoglycerol geranylgeranyltransferase
MMRPGSVETRLVQGLEKTRSLFFVLLDPDSDSADGIIEAGLRAARHGADALLLGGSFVGNPNFMRISQGLKKETQVPVILFPGGCSHVTPGPDALLFTTLISGRNPQYLIDEQVKGAVLVRGMKMEAIPTAYMLIESGRTTAVEYISNTRPIPSDKPAIAAAHAMAAELMGQRWIYLEAGSGALNAVPAPMVQAVRASVDMHVIVGGGIRTPELARERAEAGAHAIVVGNHFESNQDEGLIKAFAQAVHGK